MKTIRDYINLIESAQTPVDERIEFLANAFADLYWGGKIGMTSATEKVKMAHKIIQAVEDGRLSVEELKQDIRDLDNKGVAEAIGQKDLISRLVKDLPRIDDPKNKDAESVKWTGPGKDDYGYTGYQGHGMPTDKQERDRIRADKKKGVAEDSEAHRLGSQAAARGRPYSTNPYPAGSKNHLEWSQAHNSIRARRAQEVDEQATPEAVAKINSLFSK